MKKLAKIDIAKGHVIHCPTYTEAVKLCTFLKNLNFKWRSGDSYDITRWNDYKDQTCYSPYDGYYSRLGYYTGKGREQIEYDYNIITVDEFINLFN